MYEAVKININTTEGLLPVNILPDKERKAIRIFHQHTVYRWQASNCQDNIWAIYFMKHFLERVLTPQIVIINIV